MICPYDLYQSELILLGADLEPQNENATFPRTNTEIAIVYVHKARAWLLSTNEMINDLSS